MPNSLASGIAPHRLSAAQAAREIAAGRLTCEALAADCLDHIGQREASVQAWAHIDPRAALQAARELDRAPRRGALHGVPIGVKDIIDTHDMPTQYGSPIYRGHRSAADAGCVAMCRAAGALILGKTVTTEFATRHPGKTRNPHRPTHTPGGSSSGSAAAVADFMVPLAIGTQTGGSVIRPASYCGVFGFKPSLGLIGRAGVKPLSESLDTIGAFGRDIADVGLLVAGLSGRPEFLDIESAAPPRIAVYRTPEWEQAEPATREALARVSACLTEAGVDVARIGPTPGFATLAGAHQRIEYFEIARSLRDEYARHADQLSPALRDRIQAGLQYSSQEYDDARHAAAACRADSRAAGGALFGGHDFLLTPSVGGEAPLGLESTGTAVFNRAWTLLGLPALNIPCGVGAGGLPIGVQLIGRFRQDRHVLAAGDWIARRMRVSSLKP